MNSFSELQRSLAAMERVFEILALPAEADQLRVARDVIARGLSVREAERLVTRLITGVTGQKIRRGTDRDVLRLQEELAQKLGTRVTIKSGSKGRGALIIDYTSLAQLDGLLARLMR